MLKAQILNIYILEMGEVPDHRYLLKDKGNGNELVKWEYDFSPPSNEKIEELFSQYQDQKELNYVIQKRKQEYPDLGEFADAYVKQAIIEKEGGKVFSKEMEEYIQKCVDVKKRNPKRKKKK